MTTEDLKAAVDELRYGTQKLWDAVQEQIDFDGAFVRVDALRHDLESVEAALREIERTEVARTG